MTLEHRWNPLEPLTAAEESINLGMQPLIDAWKLAAIRLQEVSPLGLQRFTERLVRRLSVETGIIERLYDVDRGTTEQLVEAGFREDLVSPSSTDVEPVHLVTVLNDHESAWQLLMECVNGDRELTIGFIHELHQGYTAHQPSVTAHDRDGRQYDTPLLRGAFKLLPNTVTLQSGDIYEYCPPLQVQPEMERLLALVSSYGDKDPVLVAAWLHHRFVQIHPYQDGNGRVARALTNLALLKAGLLPVVVDREDRIKYLNALEAADAGDIMPFVAFLSGLVRQVMAESVSVPPDPGPEVYVTRTDGAIAAVTGKLRKRREFRGTDFSQVNQVAETLGRWAQSNVKDGLNALCARLQEEPSEDNRTRIIADTFDGPQMGEDAHYRQEVRQLLEGTGRHANFDLPSYFYGGGVRRSPMQMLCVVSLHHLGVEDYGIMEATFFAVFQKLNTFDEAINSEEQLVDCSTESFVFAFGTRPEDVRERFASWLDESLAAAIHEFGERM